MDGPDPPDAHRRPTRGGSDEGRGEVTSTDNPRRNEARPSIGELVASLSEKLSTLIRAEIQLAKTEMAEKAKNAGIGIGLFAAAGTLAFFGTAVLITTMILGPVSYTHLRAHETKANLVCRL